MKKVKLVVLFLIISLVPFQGWAEDKKPRPFYEYKGDYRQVINDLKKRFFDAYGYNLLDLDMNWRPREIEVMLKAFDQLPPSFYRLEGLKGFYRTGAIGVRAGVSPDEVPAAAFPAFSTIYRGQEKRYNLYVENDFFRLEFYNSLFAMDEPEAINVIQHEMAHALDIRRGFLSISEEWLEISRFRILNLPPLDAREGGDFLFAFLNDSGKDRYAPVSVRHRETYSRLNPQEDFANAVSAYIHYPYFRQSNPERYRYLKKMVFEGKEYFSNRQEDFRSSVMKDLESKMASGDWKGVRGVLIELGRGHYPDVAQAAVEFLLKAEEDLTGESAMELATASCYLMLPDALKFRRNLAVKKKVSVQKILSHPKCKINGRDSFEKFFAKFPLANIYFYRENGRDYAQFMDPVLSPAFMRGFDTRYVWELGMAGGQGKPIAGGQANFSRGGNGSVKLDLMKTAARKYLIPPGRKLYLRVRAKRNHPKNFRGVESDPAQIQFVLHPWFEYFPGENPDINVVYPVEWAAGKKGHSGK